MGDKSMLGAVKSPVKPTGWTSEEKAAYATPIGMQKSNSLSSKYNTNMNYAYAQQNTAYSTGSMSSSASTASYAQTSEELKNYMYEKNLYELLSQEIEKETSQITTMVNMIQRYRQDIKRELEIIAYNLFRHSHVVSF